MSHGSSIQPQPGPPDQAPDPKREEAPGFDAWRKAKVDSMLIVPRASTHLEYTDIAYAMPASRYGQDLTSVYVQAWLDQYLKHEGSSAPAVGKAAKPKRKTRRHAKRTRHRRHRAAVRADAVGTDPLLATSLKYL